MKTNLKKMISLCLVLVLALAAVPCAQAAPVDNFLVESYRVTDAAGKTVSKITKSKIRNNKVNIEVTLWHTENIDTTVGIIRRVDSFSGGTVMQNGEVVSGETISSTNAKTTFTIAELTYSGIGNTLSFTVSGGGNYQEISIPIAECEEYVEPTPEPDYDDPVEPTPAPRAVITYSGLPELLASGETATVDISIQNTGKTAMKAPILNFAVSDSLLIADGKYTAALSDIKAGSTVSVQVPIKVFGKVTAQKQSIDVSMTFDYYNDVATVSSEASANIIVPCKLSEDSEEEPTASGRPVPIVILSGYSYGGASIAAGSEATLRFTFTNTSKLLAVENVVLKVATGADLQLNGSTNTFYFESVGAGGSKSVTVPVKAAPMISGSTQDVGLSFSYEYVDDGQRRERTSEMSISIPLYQPDRLEISEPVVAYVGYVGEETSLTLDYVNKGKSEVSNVEATISGDVDSYNSFVRVGNIPSGKSGTIAFAVTPMLEGDNKATITVSYEDANGDVKERVFETTLSAMPMEEFDPGEWEEPIEPIDEGDGFPWWIIILAAVVLAIIIIIVARKKRKKAKLAAQQELWDDWDDDDGAGKAAGAAGAVTEETK